jgi:hypothetical protein
MARDNLPNNGGIAWVADPEPEVFEYLVYWKETDGDDADWLASIDAGGVTPNAQVVAPTTQWLFPDGQPEDADYAVVSHARNDVSKLERWSTPHSPSEFQDIPLDPSAAELVGPSGGRVLSDG